MGFEPAARGELGRNAGGEQQKADREGAEDPVDLHAALEHEAVEQGEDEDQDGGLGEEARTAMGADGDEVYKWRAGERGGGWSGFAAAACGKKNEAGCGRSGGRVACLPVQAGVWLTTCREERP